MMINNPNDMKIKKKEVKKTGRPTGTYNKSNVEKLKLFFENMKKK